MSRKKIQYIFEFKHAQVKVNVDPEQLSESDEEQIQRVIDQISKNIYIDKSYVSFKDSKYEKTFISEEGWNELHTLLKKTDCGQKVTKKQNETLQEMYMIMILEYLYQFLDDLNYDIGSLYLELTEDSSFMVGISEDLTTDFYSGKWQNW